MGYLTRGSGDIGAEKEQQQCPGTERTGNPNPANLCTKNGPDSKGERILIMVGAC